MLFPKLCAKPGHGFELAVRVTDETDNDVGGAGTGEAPQEFSRALARTAIARLPPAHRRSRLPVIPFEKSIDPLVSAARIFIDRQGR